MFVKEVNVVLCFPIANVIEFTWIGFLEDFVLALDAVKLLLEIEIMLFKLLEIICLFILVKVPKQFIYLFAIFPLIPDMLKQRRMILCRRDYRTSILYRQTKLVSGLQQVTNELIFILDLIHQLGNFCFLLNCFISQLIHLKF